MAEIKRVQLQSVNIEKVDIKKPKKPEKEIAPSIRFNLELFEANDKQYPEFKYAQLLKEAQKKHRKEKKKDGNPVNGSELLYDDTEEKVLDIARYFESKYGNRKKHDDVDLGAGYDESDSFIDNTDAYDELVPEEMTTEHGGFYINSGPLDFQMGNNISQLRDRLNNGKSEEESSSSSDEEDSDDSEDDSDDDEDEDEDEEENKNENDKDIEKKISTKNVKKSVNTISSSSENEETEDKDNSSKPKPTIDNSKSKENKIKSVSVDEPKVQPSKITKQTDPAERKQNSHKIKPQNNNTVSKVNSSSKNKRMNINDFELNPTEQQPSKKKKVDNSQSQVNHNKTKKTDSLHNQGNPVKTKKLDNTAHPVKHSKIKQTDMSTHHINPPKAKQIDNTMYQNNMASMKLENPMFQLNSPYSAKQIENAMFQVNSQTKQMNISPFNSFMSNQIDITPCQVNPPGTNQSTKQLDIGVIQVNSSIANQLDIKACPPNSSKIKHTDMADIYKVNSNKNQMGLSMLSMNLLKSQADTIIRQMNTPSPMNMSDVYQANSSHTKRIDTAQCFEVNPLQSKQFEIGECQVIPTKSKRNDNSEPLRLNLGEPKLRTDNSYNIVD